MRHVALLAASTLLLAFAAVRSAASPQATQVGQAAARSALGPPVVNHPPVITTSLGAHTLAHSGDDLEFQVTVTDPEGDPVTLRPVNPMGGMVFPPVEGEPSPVTVDVRWGIASDSAGRTRVRIEAFDALHANVRTRYEFDVTVNGRLGDFFVQGSRVVTGDVTGDGAMDVVAVARFANKGGVGDTGALYVWAGQATPGGAPTATLVGPGMLDDMLGQLEGQAVQLVDLTGDGVLDILTGSPWIDANGKVDSGALLVYAGGAGLSGTVGAHAVLSDPTGDPDDNLGDVADSGLATLVSDFTGDGVLDVAVIVRRASVGTASQCGKVLVFRGGPSLAGQVAPHATLVTPNPVTLDLLGASEHHGFSFCDLTGDGVDDILASSHAAGPQDTGAIYLWKGGVGLSGLRVADAEFSVPNAQPDDELTNNTTIFVPTRPFEWRDVTGDGTLDLVAAAAHADIGGVVHAGALYVWAGDAGFNGAMAPTATLTRPGAIVGDQLGDTGAVSGHFCELVDVTGDGTADIVTGGQWIDVGGSLDAGALIVFQGGPGLSGSVAPIATLASPNSIPCKRLGFAQIPWCHVSDLDGDLIPEILIGGDRSAPYGITDAGAVFIWRGGATLTGAPSPWSICGVPSATSGDHLSLAEYRTISRADVTGDGVRDLIVGARVADAGVSNVGAIYVWDGGQLVGMPPPTATLIQSGALAGESVTTHFLGDLTGDGVLDVVGKSTQYSGAGILNAGAVHVWSGGASLTGTRPPTATLFVPTANPGDQLGETNGWSTQFVDLGKDGILDLVSVTQFADANNVLDSGAVYVFQGTPTLSGLVAPVATLTVPGAKVMDELGAGNHQGAFFTDVTGDGLLDILGVAPFANVAGAQDAGALYLWQGGPLLIGPLSPLTTMTVPGAKPSDQLGG